ncbi:MAG: hypothetical protein PHE11_07475, partial [Candidatus Omnitrophica bacterium]|nr:hypothetical protein [Candidatus Omnitrophota bacterium]
MDGLDSTDFATAGHDHDSDYLGITAKAADSDKLDNIDSTGFVQTSGNQTVGGIKTFTSIPALPATNPTTANQAVRKGFADATYLGISAKAADSDKLDGLDSTAFAKVITLTAGDGLTGGGDLSADRTFDVLAGLGIDFDVDGAVIVDLTENYAWTGNHSFTQPMYAGLIMPHVSDLYDLGDSAHLWRKIFASELSAVVFAKYEQVLLGGWFTVSKGEGVLPADILSTDTTIDLGADTFEVGDIIVFRGISATNTPQVEYIKIASDLSGTLYGVTRDLDGTGANNWQTGTVFANYGRLGDGRIELNAYDSPRISVFSHADTIAGFREQVRIGDLINGWGYSASTYGGAFGSYESGKANITIDPTNGIRIRNYDQTVIQLTGTEASFENVIKLGTSGRLQQGTGAWGTDFTGSAIWSEGSPAIMMMGGWNNNVKQWWGGSDGKLYAGGGDVIVDDGGINIKPGNSLKFLSGDSEQIAKVEIIFPGHYNNCPTLELKGDRTNDLDAAVSLFAVGGTNNIRKGLVEVSPSIVRIDSIANTDDIANITLYVQGNTKNNTVVIDDDTVDISANLVVDGTIKDGAGVGYLKTNGKAADSDKLDGLHSTDFGRPVFLTAPLTSTAWDGDARSTTAKTKIDLSVVFGVPAGAKGIFVRLVARDSGSSAGYCQLALSPNATAGSVAAQAYLQGVQNDVYVSVNG